jgi:hypothetical protein
LVGDCYRFPPPEELHQAVVTSVELVTALRLQNSGQPASIYVEPAVIWLARHFNPFGIPYPLTPLAIFYRRWPALVQLHHRALHAAFREIVTRLRLCGLYEGHQEVIARASKRSRRVSEELLARLKDHAVKLGAELPALEKQDQPPAVVGVSEDLLNHARRTFAEMPGAGANAVANAMGGSRQQALNALRILEARGEFTGRKRRKK